MTTQWTARKDRLLHRTLGIIEKHGRILLKRRDDQWYLHAHTNLAGGTDGASWGLRNEALPFYDLNWAHKVAKYYDCKVVVVYPKREFVHSLIADAIRWTAGPLGEKQKKALIQVITMAGGKLVKEDFMKIRHLLTTGDLETAPQPSFSKRARVAGLDEAKVAWQKVRARLIDNPEVYNIMSTNEMLAIDAVLTGDLEYQEQPEGSQSLSLASMQANDAPELCR